MNKFLNELKEGTNFTTTENGAIAHKSTLNKCLDLFAMGASYRNRSDEDCIDIFREALEENKEIALKLLFYIADARGGQGERRFFKVCFRWLALNYPKVALKNLSLVPDYRRWDCLIKSTIGTPVEEYMFRIVKNQLVLDINSKTPSLLAKWLSSENASSKETKGVGIITRKALGLSSKQYRKTLSTLRERIGIVETLMSSNRWDEIEFDKIPSKAGFIYTNAFARRDIISAKYEAFAKDEEAKVNAGTLYPYEITQRALDSYLADDTEINMIDKYWNSLPNYFNEDEFNAIAVVDTSASMRGTPMDVAISLGIYMAERCKGPFANHYISFSSSPNLVEVKGDTLVDKARRIYKTNIVSNTDIEKTFDLVLKTAIKTKAKQSEIPKTMIVISDMEFDCMSCHYEDEMETLIENMAKKFNMAGYKIPNVVYWNVDSRHSNIPAIGEGISYVSGFSPSIFETIITGKTGYDLMMETIGKERYDRIMV